MSSRLTWLRRMNDAKYGQLLGLSTAAFARLTGTKARLPTAGVRFHPGFLRDWAGLNEKERRWVLEQIPLIVADPESFRPMPAGYRWCHNVLSRKLRIIYYKPDRILWFLLVERRPPTGWWWPR